MNKAEYEEAKAVLNRGSLKEGDYWFEVSMAKLMQGIRREYRKGLYVGFAVGWVAGFALAWVIGW